MNKLKLLCLIYKKYSLENEKIRTRQKVQGLKTKKIEWIKYKSRFK